jgi:hypothetical protein
MKLLCLHFIIFKLISAKSYKLLHKSIPGIETCPEVNCDNALSNSAIFFENVKQSNSRFGGTFHFHKKFSVYHLCKPSFIMHTLNKTMKPIIQTYYSTLLQRNGAWFGKRLREALLAKSIYVPWRPCVNETLRAQIRYLTL